MTDLTLTENALTLLILMAPWLLMVLVVSGICDFLEWRRERRRI